MPVFGRMPVATPIFTKVWNANMPAMPAATSWLKVSLADIAITIHRKTIKSNMARTNIHPRNPNSSPITEKIKSLCGSGR